MAGTVTDLGLMLTNALGLTDPQRQYMGSSDWMIDKAADAGLLGRRTGSGSELAGDILGQIAMPGVSPGEMGAYAKAAPWLFGMADVGKADDLVRYGDDVAASARIPDEMSKISDPLAAKLRKLSGDMYHETSLWPDMQWVTPNGTAIHVGNLDEGNHWRAPSLLFPEKDFSQYDESMYDLYEKFGRETGAVRAAPVGNGIEIYKRPTTEQIQTIVKAVRKNTRPEDFEWSPFNIDYFVEGGPKGNVAIKGAPTIDKLQKAIDDIFGGQKGIADELPSWMPAVGLGGLLGLGYSGQGEQTY
jgi:hypothetical protein